MSKALADRRPKQPPPPPAVVVRELASIEHALGGRAALVAALSHAPKSKDLDYVLGLIGDPANDGVSLAVVCQMGGITSGELITAYRTGEIHRAQALATQKIGAALPGVVADTMRRAAPHEGTCDRCKGLGQVVPKQTKANPNPEPEDCPACEGKGRRDYEGDLEHKKLALEIGQMTSKGGGLAIQVNNNSQQNVFTGGSVGGALEKMQEATDRILYGDDPLARGPELGPAVVEAEVVEEAVEPAEPAARLEDDWQGKPFFGEDCSYE